MKKKIFGLAVASLLFAATASAQSPANDNCCSDKGKTEKPMKVRKEGMQRPTVNPFEGITLTETQQAQLKELSEKRRAEKKQKMEAQSADRKDRKDRAAMDSVKRAERTADKKGYLADVKNILTPDQYVIFLENFYVYGDSQKPVLNRQQGMKPGAKGPKHEGKKPEGQKRDKKK